MSRLSIILGNLIHGNYPRLYNVFKTCDSVNLLTIKTFKIVKKSPGRRTHQGQEELCVHVCVDNFP